MSKTSKFIQAAIGYAMDDSHGYSQAHRWGPDYDCSSLMYQCGYDAGYNLSRQEPRYTGSMIKDFSAVGFRVDAFDGNLGDLEPGDILLNTTHHTAVYVGNGLLVEASNSETGGVDGQPGDQTRGEIHATHVYDYPWTHVLTPPKESAEDAPGASVPSFTPVGDDVKNMPLADAVTRIAIETINGGFGNLPQRKDNIYKAVQDRVNQLLSGRA